MQYGTILVYTAVIHSLSEADDAEFENYLSRVPLWRRQRILSYRGMDDRLRSLTCSRLLAEGCAELGWDPKGVIGDNGRPMLSEAGHCISMAHSGDWAAVAFSQEPVGIDVEEIRRFTPERQKKVGKKILTDAELKYLSQFSQFPKAGIFPIDYISRLEDGMAESENCGGIHENRDGNHEDSSRNHEDCSVKPSLQDNNKLSEEQAAAFASIWTRKEAFAKRNGRGISMDFRMIDTMQEDLFYSCTLASDYVMSVCGAGTIEIRRIDIEVKM